MAIVTTDTAILVLLHRADSPLTQAEIRDLCNAMTCGDIHPTSSSISEQMEQLATLGLVRRTYPSAGHVYRPFELTNRGREAAGNRLATLTTLTDGQFPQGWKSRFQMLREETDAAMDMKAVARRPADPERRGVRPRGR